MTAEKESLMLMLLGAHPMLAKSTKALNQAQIDGLRASGVENRFWNYEFTKKHDCKRENSYLNDSIHKESCPFSYFQS